MFEGKPWYESKIIWAQIISILFAVAGIARLDIGGLLGLDEAALLSLVMTIAGVATVIFRVGVTQPIEAKK